MTEIKSNYYKCIVYKNSKGEIVEHIDKYAIDCINKDAKFDATPVIDCKVMYWEVYGECFEEPWEALRVGLSGRGYDDRAIDLACRTMENMMTGCSFIKKTC